MLTNIFVPRLAVSTYSVLLLNESNVIHLNLDKEFECGTHTEIYQYGKRKRRFIEEILIHRELNKEEMSIFILKWESWAKRNLLIKFLKGDETFNIFLSLS